MHASGPHDDGTAHGDADGLEPSRDPRAVPRDGTILGVLAPFEVDVPWWQEAGPVVVGARRAHDVDVVILRLLTGEPQRLGAGGPVTYLAEVGDDVDVAVGPWDRSRDPDEPLHASWARPGGPAEDLAWADAALEWLGCRAPRPRYRCGPGTCRASGVCPRPAAPPG